MSTSIDWTTPAAYSGRRVPAPSKRSLGSALVLRLRIWIRAQWRENQRLSEMAKLRRLGSELPDAIRRDIGLPPYDHP
jgi:hypothetical protein